MPTKRHCLRFLPVSFRWLVCISRYHYQSSSNRDGTVQAKHAVRQVRSYTNLDNENSGLLRCLICLFFGRKSEWQIQRAKTEKTCEDKSTCQY